MAIKNSQRFAEIEYCLQHYFDGNVSPVMKSVREDLTRKQCKELADYQNSAAGILSGFAAGMSNNIYYNPIDTLKHTGKWNSKTAEDYVEMCKKNILGNKNLQSDLVKMADEWRTAVVKEIGRDRYNALSKELKCDLAFAYVDYRVDQMMIDYMVKQEMPKSSVEYILRKGAEGSLLGLASTLSKSPLQEEIDRRGEAAYKPSKAEIGASKAMSFGSDLIMTGGYSSWAKLGSMAVAEVVFTGAEYAINKKAGNKKQLTVEQCISQGVFGSQTNVFDSFRNKSKSIVSYENKYVLSVNKSLKNKMSIWTEKPPTFDWFNTNKSASANPLNPFSLSAQTTNQLTSPFLTPLSTNTSNNTTKPRNPNVPLVVAPGHEEEYLQFQKEQKAKDKTEPKQEEPKQETQQPITETTATSDSDENQQQETNESGWANLLQSVGLDGISDVGRNLPYVIAMLPDMLVGMFTGKTQSVGLKKDMIPIASILMGMFVDNPLLKMVLIGMGGANLVNKIGHEAIERQQPTQQYKQYADEELNPRISNPVVQGNTLVASIDNVPCSVTITENAAQAYASGALPLNTLANAVLAKYDQTYSVNNAQNIDMNSTVNRDRGITLR
jgi:hypothetical protein